MSDQATASHTIDSIVDQLDRFHQRATYGAVASIVNRSPRNLMDTRSRCPRDSWVVSRQSGMPTGYEPELLHPKLTTRENVISTREDLESWLASPN
ncbi:MAG TPA: hypothetical protein VM053_10030 [Gemmatimonadaceae bacterium]|nr:hypothetical protein [Gemmatimonadaceae bacterium]